jgi:NAD(P)H-dependent FMN reductase
VARAIEQLREVAVEMQLAPTRAAVHVPAAALFAHFQGQDITPHLTELDAVAEQTIDDLLWWTEALKTARAS